MNNIIRICLVSGLWLAQTALSGFTTYTVAKTDSVHQSGWAYYIGQTFQPSVQGPQGSGTIPAGTTTANLLTFKVYPWAPEFNPPAPVPSMAYIYDAFDLPDFSDAIGTGPVLGTGTHLGDGLYDFGGLELTLNNSYVFIMADAASIRYWQSSDYTGGEGYWTNASTVGSNQAIQPFNTDIDFTATMEVIPEPGTIALLLGLGSLGLVALRRRR